MVILFSQSVLVCYITVSQSRDHYCFDKFWPLSWLTQYSRNDIVNFCLVLHCTLHSASSQKCPKCTLELSERTNGLAFCAKYGLLPLPAAKVQGWGKPLHPQSHCWLQQNAWAGHAHEHLLMPNFLQIPAAVFLASVEGYLSNRKLDKARLSYLHLVKWNLAEKNLKTLLKPLDWLSLSISPGCMDRLMAKRHCRTDSRFNTSKKWRNWASCILFD